MQVGATDTRTANTHDHVGGPPDLRISDLFVTHELVTAQRFIVFMQHGSFHVSSPCIWMLRAGSPVPPTRFYRFRIGNLHGPRNVHADDACSVRTGRGCLIDKRNQWGDSPQVVRKASLGIRPLSQNRTLDRAAAAVPVAKWDICTARICQHRFTGILDGGLSVVAFERCADVSGYRNRL